MKMYFVGMPNLPHLRLPKLMETYKDIHRTVFSSDHPELVLKRMLDDSYMNYVTDRQSIEDLSLILFYGDFVKADTEQKREDFKNSLNKEFLPKQFSIDLPGFTSMWIGKKV
jgi:hypothetical protein